MPTTKNPAPVDTGSAPIAPVGPLDKGPAPVPQGAATGVYPSASSSSVPQATSAKPVAVSSKETDPFNILPVTEQPVDVANTVQVNTNVSPTLPRYVSIYGNGNLVVQAASTLNFTGNAVTVTAGNSSGAAQISINSQGGANIDWNNIGNNILPSETGTYELGSGSNRWATLYAVNVGTTGDVSAVGNIIGNYILGNGAGLTGITEIVNNNYTWTFDDTGALNLAGAGVVRRQDSVNVVSNGFAQLQWVDSGNLNIPDPNYTGGPTNWAYVDATGFNIQTNYNGIGETHTWSFNTDGNLDASGNINVGGALSVTGNIYAANIVSQGNLVVYDPLVYFVANVAYPYNYDIGFYSHFVGGVGNTYQHTGLVRDSHDNTWKFFSNVPEPSGSQVNLTNAIYDAVQTGPISVVGNVVASGDLNGNNLNLTTLSVATFPDDVIIEGIGKNVNLVAPTGWQVSQATDTFSQLYWTSNLANLNTSSGNDNFIWAYVHQGGFFVGGNIAGNNNPYLDWNYASDQLALSGNVIAKNISASGTVNIPFGPSNQQTDVNLIALTQALIA